MSISKSFASRLLKDKVSSGIHKPDQLEMSENIIKQPADNFVLCRDKNGNPTAIYKSLQWDFAPIATTNNKCSKLYFKIKSDLENTRQLELELISEVKTLLFQIIYLIPRSGKFGTLSVTTLHKRFCSLMDLARYCLVNNESTNLFANFSLKSILSNETYLYAYVKTLSENKQSELSNLLNNLKKIKKSYLGFSLPHFKKNKPKSEQTPLIPLPIYLQAFDRLTAEVNKIWEKKDDIEALIGEFKYSDVGLQLSTIKNKKIQTDKRDMSLTDLLRKHNLLDFFTKHYPVEQKSNLVRQISSIQLTCKHLIHFLTGMRHEEVLHMKYDCIKQSESTPRFGYQGNSLNARMVSLISSSTKYFGYKKECYWLAPKIVVKAIEILQAIVRGLSVILKVDSTILPLFQSAQCITHKNAKSGVTSKSSDAKVISLSNLLISDKDRSLLLASDEQRTFHEQKFQIGNPWVFTTHQYRRSLAYYGAHTGLISDATGAEQFKQTTLEMQRYYRRGYSKIASLFGFYDSNKKEFTLPNDHFLYEFQTGVTIEIARQVIAKIFDLTTKHFGKKRNYIERSREGLKDNEIKILEAKKETEIKARKGELAYRKTIVGGCLKNGDCDDFMLGNFSACVSCFHGDIELPKVNKVIASLEEDLKFYPSNSGEYQLTKRELTELTQFKNKSERQGKL